MIQSQPGELDCENVESKFPSLMMLMLLLLLFINKMLNKNVQRDHKVQQSTTNCWLLFVSCRFALLLLLLLQQGIYIFFCAICDFLQISAASIADVREKSVKTLQRRYLRRSERFKSSKKVLLSADLRRYLQRDLQRELSKAPSKYAPKQFMSQHELHPVGQES